MSGLTRVNQRLGPNNAAAAAAAAAQPSAILYPPSGPSSGRASPYPAPRTPSGIPSPFPRPPSTGSASQYSESPYGAGGGPGTGYTRTAHDLESHNDDRLEGLLGKVKILKDITVGIGNEVRDGNLELGGMNDAFSSTSNFLSGTFKRMTKMARKQGSNWCWFMGFLLLVLWIFIVLWWLRR